jgi:hypothetical protein
MIIAEWLLPKTLAFTSFVYIEQETPTLFRLVSLGPWPADELGPEIPDGFESEAAVREFAQRYLTYRQAHGWGIDPTQSFDGAIPKPLH